MKSLPSERMLTLWQASEYLAKHAKDKRTANLWFGYLKHNPKKYLEQDGIKVVCHVIDGELRYTESALKSFIKVMGDPSKRTSVNTLLDAVDAKKVKSSKTIKPKAGPKSKKISKSKSRPKKV